jgi:hypothetical protein
MIINLAALFFFLTLAALFLEPWFTFGDRK